MEFELNVLYVSTEVAFKRLALSATIKCLFAWTIYSSNVCLHELIINELH